MLSERLNIGDHFYYVSTIVFRDSQREFTDENGTVWVEKKNSTYYRLPFFVEYRVIATMYTDYSDSWPVDERWDSDEYLGAFVKAHHISDEVDGDEGNWENRTFRADRDLFTSFEEAKAELEKQLAKPVN